MSKTALILGAAGQDGFYLSERLAAAGVLTHCAARSREGYLDCDVGNFEEVSALVASLQPDYIFHLAAVSSADHSALFPNERAIVDGTVHVLEAARNSAPSCRVFIAGSALQFRNLGVAIEETSPLSFSSAYAAQRNASLFMTRYFRERFDLSVFFGYFFHHDSPRRSGHHMAQKIARAARLASTGSSDTLFIDDWNYSKEWMFAGDCMQAVWLLVNQSRHFEVVIGNGQPRTLREWAEECFAQLGLDYRNYVETRNHTSLQPPVTCYPARLKSIGWEPKVSFQMLAQMMTQEPYGCVDAT